MSVTPPTARRRLSVGRPTIRLLAAVLVLVGFTLQGFLPGLDLAFRGDLSRNLFGVESDMCHSSSQGRAERTADTVPADEEGRSHDHGCCLVCQTAGSSQGALPLPTFKIPTRGAASHVIARLRSDPVVQRAFRQNPARAPPAAVA